MERSWRMTGITLVILLMLGLAACQEPPEKFNAEFERPRVEQAIHNCIGWAKNKNLDLLYSVIANDSNLVEVSPSARISRGFSEFKQAEAFWMHEDFKAVRYEIRDLDIHFSESGTVAWYVCMLDDINTWKGQPANWENTRWTGVLEKRNGSWVIVQMHFSFAEEG